MRYRIRNVHLCLEGCRFWFESVFYIMLMLFDLDTYSCQVWTCLAQFLSRLLSSVSVPCDDHSLRRKLSMVDSFSVYPCPYAPMTLQRM